ncbi:hypothetical protein [Stappia sp. BW2]|uniref:hypothetical protein n=1 Tax=Stappia sp. BW2 TaxID=2592622 RepID=UPI0012943CCB|nr:hypothetical protein [Stappia sp. BW2]
MPKSSSGCGAAIRSDAEHTLHNLVYEIERRTELQNVQQHIGLAKPVWIVWLQRNPLEA